MKIRSSPVLLALTLGLLLLGLALAVLGGPVPTAYAATPIFVRPDGSDTACNGTVDAPASAAPACAVQTIQQGIDLADSGGQVNVAAGIYVQALNIAKPLTLQGSAGAILETTGNKDCINIDSSNVTVDGMTLRNCRIGIVVYLSKSDYGASFGYQNIRLSNNSIYNMSGSDRSFGVYLGTEGERYNPADPYPGLYDPSLTKLLDFTGLQVSNNTISNTGRAGVVLQSITATGQLSIRGNEVYSSGASGIWIDGSHNIDVYDNNLHHNGVAGVYLSSYANGYHGGASTPASPTQFIPENIQIRHNHLHHNREHGLKVDDGAPATLTIAHNRLVSNAGGGLGSLVTPTVNAQNNWWGCNEGPNNDPGCNPISATVNANPWLVLGLVAVPPTLPPSGGASILSASLTTNSNGAGGFLVPDNTPVTFTTTRGTVNPQTAGTLAGVVTSTLTLSANLSETIVSATVDNETVALTFGPKLKRFLYLPFVAKDFASGPDLVVESLAAGQNNATVTIRNQGNKPVTDPFWVDVYFDPGKTPGVNDPWDTIADYGVVWNVSGANLPLAANSSLVLGFNDRVVYFNDRRISADPPYPVGVPTYAFVDSVDFSATYGAVEETHEGNNLLGPVTSIAGASGR